eukprot:2008876-Prymnesium_polylepis.1
MRRTVSRRAAGMGARAGAQPGAGARAGERSCVSEQRGALVVSREVRSGGESAQREQIGCGALS